MSDFSIQFHAAPQELIDILKGWVLQHNLHVVLLQHGPFSSSPLLPEELCRLLVANSTQRLALMIDEPDLTGVNAGNFSDLNPNRLTVDLGVLKDKTLGESWITTRTCDPIASLLWKSLANDLKRQTKVGATAVHPITGATSMLKKHRYTSGALDLESRGVQILPAAGITTLRLRKKDATNGDDESPPV